MTANTLVDRLEGVVEAVGERSLRMLDVLGDAFGERPYGHPRITTEEQALAYMPEWFVFTQADPIVSVPYWLFLNAELKKADPEPIRVDHQADMTKLDNRMRELYARDPGAVAAGATPELMRAYATLLLAGLHTGEVRPPVQAIKPEPMRGAYS